MSVLYIEYVKDEAEKLIEALKNYNPVNHTVDEFSNPLYRLRLAIAGMSIIVKEIGSNTPGYLEIHGKSSD